MATQKKVSVYDTTLRDGNQALGISLSLTDKLLIAQHLNDLGIHYIEGGWPNPTNPIDTEFYEQAAKLKLTSKLAVFGSTKRPGNSCANDPFTQALVASRAPVATIFGKSWDLHVTQVLRLSLQENIDIIAETVQYLKKHMQEVVYDAEHFFDGYKHNPEYAIQTLIAAQDAGADVLALCDTNGGMLPDDFLKTWREVASKVTCPLGIHTHNDSGCAEANSMIAVSEGAIQVQGTINGLGERCGNANLCTIIPNLQVKKGIKVLSDESLRQLTETSIFVSEVANIAHNIRQPYVGECAFSHKAGAHADGVRKVSESFEHIRPQLVGNKRQFVVSAQAGSSTMLEKLALMQPGLDKHDPLVKKLLLKIKTLEGEGYQFEAADASFELLAEEMLGHFTQPFEFKGYRVIEEIRCGGEVFSEATIKVCKGDDLEHTAAEGDGPVNALDNALRKSLAKFYPHLADVKLEDFKVRVLDGREGTAAKVRVLIESSDGKSRWGTVGVSTNLIEAAWLALVDSLTYKLMKDTKEKKRGTGKKKKA